MEEQNQPRIESSPDGGEGLGFVDRGTWVRYSNIYFSETPKSVAVRAATQSGPIETPGLAMQIVYVKIAPVGGSYEESTELAHIIVSGSSWSVYETFKAEEIADIKPGAYDVFLDFSGGVNINWFSIGE